MMAPRAIAVLLVAVALGACAEAAAKAARSRLPASRTLQAEGQTLVRKKPPVASRPAQYEKNWMDRASAPSNGGGGGGM